MTARARGQFVGGLVSEAAPVAAHDAAPKLSIQRVQPVTSEWIEIPALRDDSPGDAPAARERWGRRRAREIRRETYGRDAKMDRASGRPAWVVRASAEWADGKTAGELCEARQAVAAPIAAPAIKPPGWDDVDDRDKARHLTAAWARDVWQQLRDREFPHLKDEQRYPIYAERCSARLKSHSIGTSLSTVYRLVGWNPAETMWRDGRRERGAGRAGPPGSEGFRSYLSHVYMTVYRGQRGGIKTAWKIACGWAAEHGETGPSYNQARLWLNREFPEPVRAYYQNERRWLREHVESVRRDKGQYRPGAWWSGDWHLADCILTHNGKPIRPWLAVWEDMCSGLVPSWVLAPRPNSEELIMCFGDGVLAWGAPLHLLIDNGKDYRARAFTGGKRLTDDQHARLKSVCQETGTTPHFCWPFNPGSKPPESWFKSFCTRVSMLFETYCGNKPDKRPEHLYADMRANRINVPTLDEAREHVGRFIESVANREPKPVLGGRSPLEVFQQDDPIPKRTAPEHVIRFKLMPRTVVKVGRGGTVMLDGVKYRQDSIKESSALFDRRGQDVQVRYDRDRSRVFVCELSGKLICEARNARLTGVNSEDVKELRSRQKAARKRCREALPAAKFAARDLDVSAMIQHQKRFVDEQLKTRKAAGAESACERDLQLLPGAGDLIDALPMPSQSGLPRMDARDPLDEVPMPETREPREDVDPLDAVQLPLPVEGDEARTVFSRVALDSAEPTDAVDDPLDALPWPEERAADDEWDDPLDTAGDDDGR